MILRLYGYVLMGLGEYEVKYILFIYPAMKDQV